MTGVTLGSRWDWYEATLDFPDDRVLSGLLVALRATTKRLKGRNGYAWGMGLEVGGKTLATVHGGAARPGECHITVTSESCDRVVPLIRRLWLHRVSRADAAVDFVTDFGSVDSLALAFAKDNGIAHRLVTDSEGGATRYLGSSKSEVQVRVYRKTEQLRALYGPAAADVPDGLVRCEVQVRPGKRPAKDRLAGVSPDDAWGFAKWSAAFAGQVLGIQAERTVTHFDRPSSWARSSYYLAQQYGQLVRDHAHQVGREAALAELVELFQL